MDKCCFNFSAYAVSRTCHYAYLLRINFYLEVTPHYFFNLSLSHLTFLMIITIIIFNTTSGRIWIQKNRYDIIEWQLQYMSESKIKPRSWAEDPTGMVSLPISENLSSYFVPIRRNSIFDWLRSNLFQFIQERMSVKVVLIQEIKQNFYKKKWMYNWVSSAYKLVKNYPDHQKLQMLIKAPQCIHHS